jgi:hypothetical protein
MGCNCKSDISFSPLEAGKSLAKAVVSGIKSMSSGEVILVDEAIQKERMSICTSCDFHVVTLKKSRCRVCGCFLKLKTSLRDQECPHPDGPKWTSR